MEASALDSILNASPLALIVVALGYVLPRLIVAVVALFRIPPDKLPAVLKALAELFRIGSWFGRGEVAPPDNGRSL